MKRLWLVLALLAVPALASSQTCAPATTHAACLSWTASTTPGVTYVVVRSAGSCPLLSPVSTLNSAPVTTLNYADTTVTAGATYCYSVAATIGGVQSAYATGPSGQIGVSATIPTSFPPSAPTVTAQ